MWEEFLGILPAGELHSLSQPRIPLRGNLDTFVPLPFPIVSMSRDLRKREGMWDKRSLCNAVILRSPSGMAGLGMLLRQLQMNLSKGLDPSTVGNQHPGEKKKFKKMG